MSGIPTIGPVAAARAALRRPYDFISERCRELGSDAFLIGVPGAPILCMTGRESAELFYDTTLFERRNAAPRPLVATLVGEGGVQGLDDEEHARRKQMFLAITAPERVAKLVDAVDAEWRQAAVQWIATPRIVLYDELHVLLTRAVCVWAGVPLAESEVAERSRDLVALFDRAGASLAGHLAARRARGRMEAWTRGVIERIRAGRLCPAEGAAAGVIAWHRTSGRLLEPAVAAVELLNVLRPTVAVSVYVTLAAHALHEFPWARLEVEKEVERGDAAAAERFVHEVRRFYPFFPALFARVRRAFFWNGHRLRAGTRAVLDIPGTNRDPRSWNEPDAFDPERFRGWRDNPFAFVPQGGGHPARGHRCPGEGVAVSLTLAALEWLVARIRYEVPPQDLTIDRSRMPALPRSRFAMSRIEVREG